MMMMMSDCYLRCACPGISMKQSGCHWLDIPIILYWGLARKFKFV
jgi:hypothetical protein